MISASPPADIWEGEGAGDNNNGDGDGPGVCDVLEGPSPAMMTCETGSVSF
jgi:hypothetical protein